MITTDILEVMFADMRREGVCDPEKPQLWGYFFTDPDQKKLKRAADSLIRDGYRFVEIYETEDSRTSFLHIEKVEQHTVGSLDRRNQLFYGLVEQFGLESYDGMDVGPVAQ